MIYSDIKNHCLTKGAGETLSGLSGFQNHFKHFVLTDDPLRAKMLVAHHLENAVPVREQGNLLIYLGSYKGTPMTVISSDSNNGEGLLALTGLRSFDAVKVIYIGECITSLSQHALRSVILARDGDHSLLARAQAAASQYSIPFAIAPVFTFDFVPDRDSGISGINTTALYACARVHGFAALSILTVSENTATGESMEEHERRSRLYAAARLAFETFATK